MFPIRLPPVFSTIHCDADPNPNGERASTASRAASAIKTVKSAMSVPENELKRWRRTFDTNAQSAVESEKCVACSRCYFPVVDGRTARYLNADQFVNAIAPKGDLTKIGRAQFATLFPVADSSKRGLVSWDDFVVFQTILKRPDADYWIAFQYFDVYVPFTVPNSILNTHRQTEITPEPSPTMSSRKCSRRTSDQMPFLSTLTGAYLTVLCFQFFIHGLNAVTGSNFTWAKRMEHMSLVVRLFHIEFRRTSHNPCIDSEFTQLMKGLQGERLRQSFKFLDNDQDGFIRPDQFTRKIRVSGKNTGAVIVRSSAEQSVGSWQRVG